MRVETERALHRALEQGEFELHYQQEVSVVDRHVVGAEALLRWRDPDRGLVGPDRFIPIAEESGLIVPIGEWVLREACAQLVSWQRDGVVDDEFVMWVNLSAVQVAELGLWATVASVLDDTDAPPSSIGLEITESALMSDPVAAERVVRALRDLGVHLAVDDFGTGYSSLGYLKRFPAGVVKIDRSFVAGLGSDADDSSIVAAVIGLSHALGRRVLAEGVETEDQLAELRNLGCDLAQGWLFGRPQPADLWLPATAIAG